MPKKDTHFCTKWYHKLDGTKKPCSRWLKQGKTVGTFLCTVCNEEKSCKKLLKQTKRRIIEAIHLAYELWQQLYRQWPGL